MRKTTKTEATCDVCGSPVYIVSSGEGTSHYESRAADPAYYKNQARKPAESRPRPMRPSLTEQRDALRSCVADDNKRIAELEAERDRLREELADYKQALADCRRLLRQNAEGRETRPIETDFAEPAAEEAETDG